MRLKIGIFTVLISFLIANSVKADEGMWLPLLLGRNYEDMKKLGLNLTEQEIYSINNSSLKDAIVSFGGFCTGEVISQKGMVLTNHHCGYGAIADASTEENNILDDGFWATSNSEEIPVPGLFATFVISIADVTEQIVKNLDENMSEDERAAKIKALSAELVKEYTEGTEYDAFVRDFFEGNEFYIFVTEKYNDVRLIGTPPQSIGKFGYDTDNWMYPRHTGDFALFRIYANSENKPTTYNEKNKPYQPKHHLPISIKGYKEGDFSMILGFPGRTDRYLSSFGVEQAISLEQPKRVDIREKKLEIMKKYMDADTKVRLNYSPKYAQVANYWKYFIGQTKQLQNNNVADKKRALEARFNEFAKGNDLYEQVFPTIEKSYTTMAPHVYARVYQSEFIYTVDLNLNIFRLKFVRDSYINGEEEKGANQFENIKGLFGAFYKGANLDIEFEILEEVLKMYYNDMPSDQLPEMVKDLGDKNQFDKFMKRVRKKSIFSSPKNFEKFSNKFSIKRLEKDPLFQLIMAINDSFEASNMDPDHVAAKNNLKRANRHFLKGYMEMEPEKKFYPNANSTLRFTYGSILPYSPDENTTHPIYTTLEGVMEKEDPNNPEFVVPEKLKQLHEARDYGRYANEKGEMVVNFITNNDITGGNSGSPVINADGQLIGTAFDGNWEAMSGDIYFEHDIQRTIVCDIRYVLFVMDKYGDAQYLLSELDIVE